MKLIHDLGVVRLKPEHKHKYRWGVFECPDCGGETTATFANVNRGTVSRCYSCRNNVISKKQKTIRTQHGMTNTKIHHVWMSMRRRCTEKAHKSYPSYGGRGITVCDEWLNDFNAFHEWAINSGYKEGLTIDRINNEGNYSPENCRWATVRRQANNRRSNRKISAFGYEKTISEWSRETGVHKHTIAYRLKKGWPTEKALTQGGNGKWL